MALTRPRFGQLNTGVISGTDPITVLHAESSSANVDVGFLINRANGLVSNVALYWNESGNAITTAFTTSTGTTDSNIAVTGYANIVTGTHTVYGAILPSANITYDLGSPTQRFRTLYLSGSTIDLGGAIIGSTNSGVTITHASGSQFTLASLGSQPTTSNASVAFGNLILSSGVTSTSASTGALQITGGAGISGNLYVGGNLDVAGTTIFRNTETVTTTEYVATINATNLYATTIGNTGATHTGNVLTISNSTSTPVTVTYTPATTAGTALLLQGANTNGGTGYFDFVKVTNQSSGATNTNKTIRLNSTGSIEIINSAYTSNLFSLTDDGNITIPGKATVNALYTTTGLFWAGNGYVISSGGGGSAAGVSGQMQYNNAGVFAGASLYAYSNSSVVATGSIASTTTTSGSFQVLGGIGVTGNLNVGATATINGNLTVGGNTAITNTLYAQGIYDNSNRVLSTSSGAGNLSISGSAVTLPATGPGPINVGSATNIPTIVTDAYGRITSLTSNAVSTTISLSGTTGTGSVAGGGTLTFASTNGITATVSSSTVTINSPQDLRTSASPTFAAITGTISTASQTNITAVGNLTSLAVSGTTSTRGGKNIVTNFTGATAPGSPQPGDEWYYTTSDILYKYVYDGTNYQWIDLTSPLYNASTSATANTIALRDTGGNLTATNFIGLASSAKYADLAEIYIPDQDYNPGTVVIFGGTEEITVTNISHDPRVAGVISTNPAYLMNSETTGLPVAFTGRVPCLVQGPVTKGELLVTSNKPGVAHAIDNTQFVPGCVIGKSLENITTNKIATIEVVVGRF